MDEDGRYVGFSGVVPINQTESTTGINCYQLVNIATYSPTGTDQPTSLPSVSPTAYPTVESTPDLGNSPGEGTTTDSTPTLSTGQVLAIVFGCLGFIGLVVLVMFKTLKTGSRYEHI